MASAVQGYFLLALIPIDLPLQSRIFHYKAQWNHSSVIDYLSRWIQLAFFPVYAYVYGAGGLSHICNREEHQHHHCDHLAKPLDQ